MADNTAEDIAPAIIEMIARQKTLDPGTITAASTFDSLQMDSLDKINLSFEVEEHFKITIPDDSLNSLKTVGDVVDGVRRLQGAQ